MPIPTCYASCSIGSNPTHTLPVKLKAIAAAGYNAIELSFPDLVSFTKQVVNKDATEKDYGDLCKAGEEVKKLCGALGLKILVLQPFSNFEGWPEGSKERDDAFVRAVGWINVMKAVGTDMLQVGSSDSPNISPSKDYLASDLRRLADMLAAQNFRLAYEPWCWATHAPTWRTVWEIVQKVDRENVGLCLDTFQIAGGEWGDPTTKSGRIERLPEVELNVKFKRSLEELSSIIPKDKIYFFQISDAYRVTPPMSPDVDEQGLRPHGRWSHDYRPMPFHGGYLPIVEVTKAVLKTGFRGWFSMEIFDGQDHPSKPDMDHDIEGYAKEAMRSHNELVQQALASDA